EWLAAMPSSLAVTSTVLMVLESPTPPRAEPAPGTVVALDAASGRFASATVPVDGWGDVGTVLSSWPKPSFSLIRSNRPMEISSFVVVSFDWDSGTEACIQHRRSDWQPQGAGRVQWAQSRRY